MESVNKAIKTCSSTWENTTFPRRAEELLHDAHKGSLCDPVVKDIFCRRLGRPIDRTVWFGCQGPVTRALEDRIGVQWPHPLPGETG